MRKRIVIPLVLAALLLAAWLAVWGVAEAMDRRELQAQWPAGLGTIDSVLKRFPRRQTNAAATKLVQWAAPLGIDFRNRRQQDEPLIAAKEMNTVSELLRGYVTAEAQSKESVILTPPVALSRYLDGHWVQIGVLRDHLLRSNVRWASDVSKGYNAPLPNLRAHMQLSRVFLASALEKGHRGDLRGWDDLHATWRLVRPLWNHPDMTSQLIALSMTRTLNAVARRMPLPEPAWLAETRTLDYRQSMLQAYQAEAWTFRTIRPFRGRGFIRGAALVVMKPLLRLSIANGTTLFRTTAAEMAVRRECDLDSRAVSRKRAAHVRWWNVLTRWSMPNISVSWQRFFRFRAELEATERVLQLRAGGTPSTTSQCSDGQWLFTRHEDGSAELRFSKAMQALDAPGLNVPLEFRVPSPPPGEKVARSAG